MTVAPSVSTGQEPPELLRGHAGVLGLAAVRAHGVEAMFTLSGAHVFPFYDAAVRTTPPMPIVDTRHEQSAVFAAEATAKLTRRPGFAVVTAGPGVTNAITPVAQAQASGAALLVVGGRAPSGRWGTGALQEMDHPPLLAPVTKLATTAQTPASVPQILDEALRVASMPHRGPVFVDVPMDVLYSEGEAAPPAAPLPTVLEPAESDIEAVADLLRAAARPVLVLGSDVWLDGADEAARLLAELAHVPVIPNGQGRGILPPGHPLLVPRARGTAFGEADLVVVIGTPLDFRLQYGVFGGRDGRPAAAVVHVTDAPGALAAHAELAGSAAGDLRVILEGLHDALLDAETSEGRQAWAGRLRAAHQAAIEGDAELLAADSGDGLHPASVYAALAETMTPRTIVIGDGGDFVSWAGRLLQPATPGRWLDPGPFGALGAGLGAAIGAKVAFPDDPVVLLLGDGAAGFSLAEVDTLVRHRLPVTVIVGNNGMWGLEKYPMRFLYGYDVAADLDRDSRYDVAAQAFGAAGETVRDPAGLAAALTAARDRDVPTVINALLDPAVAYPRSTTGV